MFSVIFLVSVALLSPTATASLYATKPIASTVYSAGHLSRITWEDSTQTPHLRDMSSLRIELFSGDHTYITTLAEGVNPLIRYHEVVIPPGCAESGSGFTMRFISRQPPLTIYTSNFTINNMTRTEPTSIPVVQPSQTSQDPFVAAPLLTLVLPNATIVSRLASTSSVSAATTVSAPPLGSTQRSGATSRKWVELEKAKFRMVFILWPTLVGLTMAL